MSHNAPGRVFRCMPGGAFAVMFAVVCAASFAARAEAGPPLTVYSVATGVQFINTADDRARGIVNNPLPGSASKLAPKPSGSGDGPFAGDVAVYSLDLYTGATRAKHTGHAVFTCYFNYAKHALCQAYYVVKGVGTVVAAGPVDFNVSGFTIIITGGTKEYIGARGEVVVAAAPHNSQRVNFELIT